MLQSTRFVVMALFAALLATGLLATSSGRLQDTQAQPAAIELNALCVNFYTSAVFVPNPITGTTCPANSFALLIPDSFPFNLAVNPYTGAVIYAPVTPPGFLPIILPDAGIVPFCMSLYTHQLRYSASNTCYGASIQILVVGQIAPGAVDDGPYTTLVNVTINEPAPGLLANDDLGLPDATLLSFGGGSLIGNVSSNGAESNVAFAGGLLSVHADGSFELVNPTIPGDYSFLYRLANPAGFDDATVTIQVQQLPTAIDDSFSTPVNQTLTVPASGLLANDVAGFPSPATITSFGGGDLGGTVTTFTPGDMPTLAGGTLNVNSDGSFSLTTPTQQGTFSFAYRLTNGVGFDDATVTIVIDAAPTVISNVPIDAATNVAADSDVAITFSEAVTVTGDWFQIVCATSGTYNPTGSGGATTVTVIDTDPTFTLDPSSDFAAGELCTVTVYATQVTDDDLADPPNTMVSNYVFNFTIADPPVANADSYDSTGNVGLDVGASDGVVLGVGADQGGGITVDQVQGSDANVGVATATAMSGSVTLDADGSFTYDPPPGYVGDDTFSYRLNGSGGTSNTATVTISISDMIWFIDNSAGAGNGTLSAPFNSIAAFNAIQGAARPNAVDGDTIFIAEGNASYTTGIDLRDDQFLIGEAAGASIEISSGITLPSFSRTLPATGGNAPTLTDAVGNAIDVATNNTLRGLDIGATLGTGINGTEVGTLFVREVNISGSGGGVDLRSTSGAAIDVGLGTVSASSSSDEGIRLNNVSGSFATTGGTISTTTLPAIVVIGAANPNEVSLGVTLTSVSANGGVNGIVLTNTAGSFTVSGGGTAGSGGTIQNMSGADGTNNGIGILLNNARSISLTNVQLNDHDNFAIRGTSVVGFTLSDSVVDGVNGTSAGADEGSISFDNLTGTVFFEGSTIEGGLEDNIVIINTAGTLNMRVQDSGANQMIIGLNSNLLGNDGILVETQSNAILDLDVIGVEFQGARSDMIQTNALGTSDQDVTIQGNTFSNGHGNSVGGGITLSGGSAATNITVVYSVSGNTFTGAAGSAITANYINGAGTVTGTIANNTIGTNGVASSGSTTGSGISVGAAGTLTHTVLVDTNTTFGIDGFSGIDLLANGASVLNATLTNNTVQQLGGFAFAGLTAMVGGSGGDTSTMCLNVNSNTFDASGASSGGNAVYLDQISATAHYNLPGYGGAADEPGASADIDAYLVAAPRSNTMTNGGGFLPFPGGVDAGFVVGVTGAGATCP